MNVHIGKGGWGLGKGQARKGGLMKETFCSASWAEKGWGLGAWNEPHTWPAWAREGGRGRLEELGGGS